jgi:GDP-L-fucose synthase
MVGAAIVRALQASGQEHILTRTHAELDLTRPDIGRRVLRRAAPAQVILAAAKVGGIQANNSLPADFIYHNLMIEANLIHAAIGRHPATAVPRQLLHLPA